MAWVTRGFARWFIVVLLLAGAVHGVEDLFSVQGIVYSGGSPLSLGNASFQVSYDACSTYFYDSGDDFNNSISSGQFDVMLGNASLTVLKFDPTQRYVYLREFVNGAAQTWNNVGGTCRQYSNPFYMDNATITQIAEQYNETALIDAVNASLVASNASIWSNLTALWLELTNYNETALILGINATTNARIDSLNATFLAENATVWAAIDNHSSYFGTINSSIFSVLNNHSAYFGTLNSSLWGFTYDVNQTWFNQNTTNYATFLTHSTAVNTYLYLNGSNANQNIDLQPYNVSAFWFKGQFNWSCANDYCDFNGTSLLINASKFTSTTYYADEVYINKNASNSFNQNVTALNNTIIDKIRNETRFVNYAITYQTDYTIWTGGTFAAANGSSVPTNIDEVPRNVVVYVRAQIGVINASLTAQIDGFDADGNSINETLVFPWAAYLAPVQRSTLSAFAVVQNITLSNAQNMFYSVGVGDSIGLPNYPFSANTDVFHFKKNAIISLAPAVNATYGTLNFSAVGGIQAGDIYQVWYKTQRS